MPWTPEPYQEWWDDEPIQPDAVSVDPTPRSVVNVLWGPDGEPLTYLLDRPPVTGYAAWLYEQTGNWPSVEVEWPEES